MFATYFIPVLTSLHANTLSWLFLIFSLLLVHSICFVSVDLHSNWLFLNAKDSTLVVPIFSKTSTLLRYCVHFFQHLSLASNHLFLCEKSVLHSLPTLWKILHSGLIVVYWTYVLFEVIIFLADNWSKKTIISRIVFRIRKTVR